MNILIVSAMFPPTRTGTSFYTRNLANTLQKQGNKVIVATVKNTEKFQECYSFDVIRLKAIHIKAKNYFKHLRITSVFYSNYKCLLEISKNNNIESVLLVNHYLDIAFIAIYVSRKLKIPLFISVGTQMQSMNPFKNRVLRIMDRIICGNFIFPFCQNIISWDAEIERYISETQSKKISQKSRIIAFGINGDQSQFKLHNHNYSVSNQIIGIGAIISQRDYLFQLRVFKELLSEFPNLRFKIIGHIYIQSPLELVEQLEIRKNVDFTGEIPHEEVVAELKNSAIHWMMLSGSYVGLGTATIEAMLLGIPAVSNVPENLLGRSLLKDMDNYIYTDGANITSAKNKISRLLLNESLRREIGTAGRKFVENRLDWDAIGQEITSLLKNENQELLIIKKS